MPLTITVERVSDDQSFLMFGRQVLGMICQLAGGGWLWCHAIPFITGIEVEKEDAGNKIMEFHMNMIDGN